MSATTELADIQQALGQLRTSVNALRSRYGELSAVRRISNDVERLDIDIAELFEVQPPPRPRGRVRVAEGDMIEVPDTPYDPALWQDADDEGVGGQGR